MHKIVALALALALSACGQAAKDTAVADAGAIECKPISDTPIWIEGGTFQMGSSEVYAEEGPQRETIVDGFWIDPHEITNAQFADFVAATGHVTIAEKPVDPDSFGVPIEQIPPFMLEPGSAVFVPPEQTTSGLRDWWQFVPGANWRKPFGPNGTDAQPRSPVVHLGWDDMVAYAAWKGGRLPTEAEWEYAASAGAENYTEQPAYDAANSWQGAFPVVNESKDGFSGLAPVGCFKPNAFGLYDMVGNVWEITADYYRPGHDPNAHDNPKGPSETDVYNGAGPGIASRVMKGGSFLCAPNYCRRYRPEARQGNDPGLGSSNVGFRLVYDTSPTLSGRE